MRGKGRHSPLESSGNTLAPPASGSLAFVVDGWIGGLIFGVLGGWRYLGRGAMKA